MASTIINSIVSNYLADYLEINPEKTKTSLLSGTVELSGIKFKKTLFTTLNIPYLELEDGYIGKINVELSLPRFYLYPIKVFIDQIYVKVRPKNVNKISEEEILKTYEIYKQKKLKEFEELMNVKFSALFEDDKKSNNKGGNGGVTMVQNIINNLYINIGKIVFIFDDCISNPRHPFSFGVTLNKMQIDSTSKDFKEKKEEDKSSPFKYKKLSIVSLNLFLDRINKDDIVKDQITGDITANHTIDQNQVKKLTDKEKEYLKDSLSFYLYCESEMENYSKDPKSHNYLLRELNFVIKVIINEKFEENKKEQLNVVMETSTILTQLSNKQMKALTSTLNYISLKDFYQQTTIDNYYKPKENLDNDNIKKYLENYSLYYKTKFIEIYKNEKENKQYLKIMEEIEKNLKLESIKALREMGNDIINNIIEISKIDKEIKGKQSSWSNYFSSKNSKDIDKLKEERVKKVDEQQKLQRKNSTMNQFKNYLEGMITNKDDNNKKREDNPLIIIKFIMKEFILIIKEDKNDQIKDVFEMKFDLLQLEIVIKELSQFISLSLRDMIFKQNLSENENYKNVLFTEIENINDDNNNNQNLILIEFEHNITLPFSPLRFKLDFGKQMYIVIDYYYLFYLYDLFLKHIEALDMNNLTSMLNEKITKIVKTGYKNLLENKELKEKEKEKEENNSSKQFNINVNVVIKAPILLLPLNFREQFNYELMYISLGHIKVHSELSDEKDINDIYDKYKVEFSNIQVKTIKNFNIKDKSNNNEGEKLIYPSTFNINVENYKYQKPQKQHKTIDNFSPLKVNILLNSIKFKLSENQIIFLVKYLENLKKTQFEFELEEKKKEKIKIKKDKVKDEESVIKKKEKDQNQNNEDVKKEKVIEKQKSKEITNKLLVTIKLDLVQMFLVKNVENTDITIDFLQFFFRESILDFVMKSNGSMKMNVSFGHFYLYDKDYKLDEQQNKIPYINPEFKCIIGTSAYGIKDKKNIQVKFSDIYQLKEESNLRESIKVSYTLDAENSLTSLNIEMCKLTISPNFSTLFRLFTFANKYFDLYSNAMNKIKYEQLREKIKDQNNIFGKKISHSMIQDNQKMKLEEVDVEDKNKVYKEEDLVPIGDKIHTKEFSIMNVIFSMKGVDVYLPLDPTSSNTSIIFMSVEIPIKVTMKTDVDLEIMDTRITKMDYNIKDIQLVLDINKSSFSIYEYRDNIVMLNSINQIFENIDVSFFVNISLDNNKKANLYKIILQMNRDIEISININHIIVFMDLVDTINDFSSKLSEEFTVKVKQIMGFKNDHELRKARTIELLQEKQKKEEKKKMKKKENQKINISNYSDIMTYDFTMRNISFKFYDIIDGLYQSLFEFSMLKTNIEFYQNSNPKDSTNLVNYLKNTFSTEHKELNTYDKDNFYMYFNILSTFEVKTLNNYLDQWEYFIEPFSINFYFCQFLKRMRPNIELIIRNMLNINLSLNLAKILQFTLEKFSMNKEEAKKIKEGKLFKNEIAQESVRYLGIETPILIFENYSGVDLEVWFDNMKYDSNSDKIIKLKNKQKFELTNSLLSNYNVVKRNNNLNSTLSYKFCLDKDFIQAEKINEKNLTGNYFNINYHHIDIHDINDSVKISIESCSDNLLCRHIFFNSLISIRNDTKYKDIKLCNHDNTQSIALNDNKKQSIPLSWFLVNKNKKLNLSFNNDSQLLMSNLSQINDINKYIKFKNGDIVLIDVVRYKINLQEYYSNKNPKEKTDIYRVDIIISSPVSLVNNTPYEFIVNNDHILSMKSLNVYNNNFNLMSEYVKSINEKGWKKKSTEKEIIMKIIKDIKLQMKYNNKLLDAVSYIDEKNIIDDDDKNEEGKAVNNFSIYNKNLSVLLKNNETKEYLVCRLFFHNPYESVSYNNKIYETMKVELNSFKYEIIFDYYFVNRTALDLYFNNKIIDKANKKDNILIPSKKYTPSSKVLLESKVKLRGKNNNWSDKFDISAIGEEFTLNIKGENETYNSIGIMIRISKLFGKSLTFIIEDKYMVINDLPFEINIKDDKSTKGMNVNINENKILLLNKDCLDKKNNFKVGVGNCYSHKFDIDKLGSYDLLISYNQEVFDERNIDTNDKLVELNNKKYYPVRCIINTDNKNTVYILFSYNNDYINQFKNNSTQNVEIILNKDKKSKCLIKPEMTIPLVYVNDKGRYENFETVKILFNDKTEETVTLNEIITKFCGKNKDHIVKIHPENNNSCKCISIYNKNDPRVMEEKAINNMIKKYTSITSSNMKIFLEGIGISIIDETPRETFYLSFYDIRLIYKFSNVTNILNEMKIYNSITFSLKNLQLDYCLDNAYDIILNPSNQLLPKKPEEIKKEADKNFFQKAFEDEVDNTPFIQFVLSQRIRQNKKNKEEFELIYSLYPEIGIIIQEFDIRINTILINSLITVVNQYMQIFFPPTDENEELKNRNDDNNENKINDVNLIIDKYNDKFYLNLKDKLLNKEGKITNLVINVLTLSAIKTNITFKVNKNAIEIRYVPELIITLINTLCSTLSSFSDAAIKLNEIIFTNVFSDFDSLNVKLMSFYKTEVLKQLYKIILNIDLLGNPVNLLEGVGNGIFNLFNEPRKGILKGPEEFGIGITRGIKGLLSNVVGGGFNSVSKITGTLLNATKNLSSIGTEEEIVVKEEEKPKGLFKGTVSGITKGFGELTHGIAGIVTKPIEQTKKGGVGGFFKGLGSGLVGAVLAPVNTVLTVGNEVTSGISNSEFISNKKRLRRFRIPRTLYKYIPINPYDEAKELERKTRREKMDGSKLVISLSNEKLFLENSTDIILYQKLRDETNMLFTNIMIKMMDKECKKFINKIYVCDIKEKVEKNNDVQLVMKDENVQTIKLKDNKSKNSFLNELNKYVK